ncbi:hypothetical protein AAVH_20067, partial [Aphelenchoides avenae]
MTWDTRYGAAFKGQGLDRLPYDDRRRSIGWVGENLYGSWATDNLALGNALMLYNTSFILANHTYYPINPRWPSDGVFPLGLSNTDALSQVFDAVGGRPEVSVVLN